MQTSKALLPREGLDLDFGIEAASWRMKRGTCQVEEGQGSSDRRELCEQRLTLLSAVFSQADCLVCHPRSSSSGLTVPLCQASGPEELALGCIWCLIF